MPPEITPVPEECPVAAGAGRVAVHGGIPGA